MKMRGRHASWRGRVLNANGYGMEGAWLVVRIPFTDRWHAFGVRTWWNG